MADFLNEKEFVDGLNLINYLSNEKLSEELYRLAEREKSFIHNEMDPEFREITIYNMTILAAAAAKIKGVKPSDINL